MKRVPKRISVTLPKRDARALFGALVGEVITGRLSVEGLVFEPDGRVRVTLKGRK